MNEKCILIVDDEQRMRSLIKDFLKQKNYSSLEAADGEEALQVFEENKNKIKLILLDVMMPKLDGLEVLRRLRSTGCRTPILLLTAKTGTEDQIHGLDLGADDYLPKPFPMELLLARVRALLRRREEFTPNILTCGNISLNQQTYILSNGKNAFTLPKLEYQLMELLMLNQKQVLTKETLLLKIWGYESEAEDNNVEVYISFLRRKLEHLRSHVKIRTIRMVGYCLESPE